MSRQVPVTAWAATFLFGASLAATSVAGTSSILRGAENLKLTQLSLPRDFHSFLASGKTGLDLEDEKTRKQTLSQAQAYISYRSSRGSAASFRQSCQNKSKSGLFCDFEARRLAPRTRAGGSSSSLSSAEKSQLIKALQIAKIDSLTSYSYRDLVRSLSASAFDDFDALMKTAKSTLAAASCDVGPLATALGGKAEEFFPDVSLVELSRQLYKKGASCSNHAGTSQARFRYSLLSVWKNKCSEAEPVLVDLQNDPAGKEFHSRAHYWRFHCAQASGNKQLAQQLKDTIWNQHFLSFHNIAANGAESRINQFLKEESPLTIRLRSIIDEQLSLDARAVEALLALNQTQIAGDYVESMLPRMAGAEPEFGLYMAVLMNRAGMGLQNFKVMTQVFENAPRLVTASTLKLYFPLWHYDVIKSNKKGLDPLLITSLIRQESAFNPAAQSLAGARGLMQVMPATARYIANVPARNLFDIPTNVRVGTKYFGHRLERYNGDVELTLAAYNAGYTRIDRWLTRYPVDNRILFMDLIPFRETRGYVSTILRNYYWYSKLYENSLTPSQLATNQKRQEIAIKALSFMNDLTPVKGIGSALDHGLEADSTR